MRIRNRGKREYRAFLMKKSNSGYEKIAVVVFDIAKPSFEFKNKTYLVNIQDNAFSENNRVTLFYDLDSGTQFSFKKFKHIIDAKELDDILTKGVIAQLFNKLRMGLGGEKGNWIMYIVMIILGATIGYVIGSTFTTKEVIKTLIQNSTGTYPTA